MLINKNYSLDIGYVLHMSCICLLL